MAHEAPTYDLLLLLSSDAPDEQRTRILSAVESVITGGGGTVERNDDWGRRPMAYEIRHSPEAEYHLLQFRAPAPLIEELSHTLRITDGVLRFRIIKVRRGTPEWKSSPPPVVSAVASSGLSGSSGEGSRPASGRPAPQAAEEEEPASAQGEGASEETTSPAETASPAADDDAAQPAAQAADGDGESSSAQ